MCSSQLFPASSVRDRTWESLSKPLCDRNQAINFCQKLKNQGVPSNQASQSGLCVLQKKNMKNHLLQVQSDPENLSLKTSYQDLQYVTELEIPGCSVVPGLSKGTFPHSMSTRSQTVFSPPRTGSWHCFRRTVGSGRASLVRIQSYRASHEVNSEVPCSGRT